MALELPALPYSNDALAPHINSQTLDIHHGKHHNAYVVNGNKLIEGTEYASMSTEDIIKATAGKADKAGVFNNAAQVWNYTFYWNSMKPGGGGKPTGAIADKIDSDLGGYDKFCRAVQRRPVRPSSAAAGRGSCVENGKLAVKKTPNAETPLTTGRLSRRS